MCVYMHHICIYNVYVYIFVVNFPPLRFFFMIFGGFMFYFQCTYSHYYTTWCQKHLFYPVRVPDWVSDKQRIIMLPKKSPFIFQKFLVLADLVKPTHPATKEDIANNLQKYNLALNSLSCVFIMVTGSGHNSCILYLLMLRMNDDYDVHFYFLLTTQPLAFLTTVFWKETVSLLRQWFRERASKPTSDVFF